MAALLRCFSLYQYAAIRDTILPYSVLPGKIVFTGSRKDNGTGTGSWLPVILP